MPACNVPSNKSKRGPKKTAFTTTESKKILKAIKKGDIKKVDTLISICPKGGSILADQYKAYTLVAAHYGNYRLVKLLSVRSSKSPTLVVHAAMGGKQSIVKFAIDKYGSSELDTAYTEAVKLKKMKIAAYIKKRASKFPGYDEEWYEMLERV